MPIMDLLNVCFILVTLLRSINAQNVQSALMFQGTGFAGSVVDATGCDITYEIECTAGTSVCIPYTDLTKTVTLNGPSLYTMTFYYTSSTSAGQLTETLYDTCTLLGTTAANCHASATVTVAGVSTTSTGAFAVTEAMSLGYAQIPITAGPAAALRSVSSCSLYGGEKSSSSQVTSGTAWASVPGSISTTAMSTPVMYPDSGLSTGAKVGIGVGVAGAILLFAGGVFLYWRRKKQHAPPPYQLNMATLPNLDQPQAKPGQRGPYEFEQPATKHEMPVGRQVQELPGHYGSYELPTNDR